MKHTCRDCGGPTSARTIKGRCKKCDLAMMSAKAEEHARHCGRCGDKISHSSKNDLCRACRVWGDKGKLKLEPVLAKLTEAQLVAPPVIKDAIFEGEAIIISDLHVPYHHIPTVQRALEAAVLLNVRTLIIAGDFIQGDTVSKYLGVGSAPTLAEEMVALKRVVEALLEVFDRIVIIPGNHDQRIEKTIAEASETKVGRRSLDKIASLLGTDPADHETTAGEYIRHFLASPKVTYYPLPQLIVNGAWLVQHPGTVSRVAPQNERKMAEKHRLSVIQGHSHLTGFGFDASGRDVAANIGYTADQERYRYIREKPTTFPQAVHGFCAILKSEQQPHGYLVPLVVHERWFDLKELARRMGGESCR